MSRLVDKAEELEKFERFLISLHDFVEEFRDKASFRGYKLDFSMSSLEILEEYLLKNDDLRDEQREDLIGEAARYLGETVRHEYGGNWKLSINDPESLYYGLPVITGHSKYDVELAPSEVIRKVVRQRKRGLLRQVLLNHVAPKRLDLSRLIEE